ncbi:MAG TPA: WHG domain-containing protein [Acidimicrobiales bacterium]|jgi:AcrR family transcriptional regulator|nr:TetR/AcrR family transcriptional regulator [Actinomycetes bacterium]MDP6105760.1 WHG domain-containing protein [Acidimicrobiales bacterium]MCP4844674.1 TetR/AcrR family transcriptional regulator [Actinomycetes bacterium]MDP6240621.1 WHG domain-containing protein [Acidimicrobiales bacterium]MDP7125621.1 WHG domain-containing protein [Acidimicrobiales bacterium]|tara:strand:+ start:6931 stop:7500 length:570 start_codon:yes stop_codon:yes gene_type:complete
MSRRTLDTDQVVAAAATLADSEGLDAVTLTRVANELGVRQPALYRHVAGFDALVRLLGLRGREILAERLAAAAVGVAGNDAVRAVGGAWREMVHEHPGLYAATDRYPCAGDVELEAAVDRVVAVLGRALAAYDLTEDEEVHAARTMRAAFHGFAHLEAGDGFPQPHDTDDTFDHMLDLLCSGIQPRVTR